MDRRRLLVALAFVAAACVPPAYRAYEGKTYRLRVPLSGPRFIHANGFGAEPVLAAGTEVRITRVELEQKALGTENRWCTRCDLPSPCPPMYQPTDGKIRRCPKYGPATWTVTFGGPEACGARGCEAVWIVGARASFADRFQAVFADPQTTPPGGAVAPGMAPDAVRARLGFPDSVVQEATDDVWRYHALRCEGAVLQSRLERELRFRSGRLVGDRVVHGSLWRPATGADHALYCGGS